MQSWFWPITTATSSLMMYTRQGAQKDAIPASPSTPTLRELPSGELCSAVTCSATRSSSIEARAAHVAALDTAFYVDPTIEEIIYSGDDGEGKYDDTSYEGDKDKDREDNRDEVSGGDDEDADKGREVDKDEDNVAEDDNDDDDSF
jgi:hypothetical protein